MKKLFSLVLCLVMVLSVASSAFAIKTISVKGIKLDKSYVKLSVGKTYPLKITFTPANTTQKLLKFSTSDKNVATIDVTGKITAVGAGDALITVTSSSNTKLFAECNIVVPFEKVNLTYWQHSSQARDDMMKALAYEFMQDNNDINIKMEFIPQSDYNTKLVAALATNAAPSVMQVQAGLVPKLVKAGAIQPLNDKIISTDTIQKDFMEGSIGALKVGGKYYGLPTDVQTIVLYWNKELVSAAGLDAEKGPQTWDEILTWAKKLTKVENGKMIQSGWGMKGYCCYIEALMLQNGGKIIDVNGKFVFADDPKSVEAVKYFTDAYRKDKIYDVGFMADWAGFRQGKIAMMLGHPAMLGNLKLTAPTVKLGIGLIPAKTDKHTSIVSSWAYVMTAKANAVTSSKFINYLASEAVEKRWTTNTGELPARKSLQKDADLLKDPLIANMIKSIDGAGVCYLHEANLYQIFVKDGFQKLILTDSQVETGLKDIQAKCNAENGKSLK